MAEKRRADRGTRFLVLAASLVLVVAGMRALRPIALPLLLAIFLSILSAPLLTWLMRHRLPKLLSVILTVLANVLVMAGALLLVGGSINAFLQDLPKYQVQFEEKAGQVVEWLESKGVDTSELAWLQDRQIASGLEPDTDALSGAMLREPAPGAAEPGADPAPPGGPPLLGNLVNLGSVFDLLASTLAGVASIVSMALLVFLMMVFILLEAGDLPAKLKSAFGWGGRELTQLMREVQRYLGIKTLISLATGILIGTWIWLIGCSYPLLWGLIAFLFNYIPSVGSIIAAVPAVLLTLLDLGLGNALLVTLGYLVTNIVLGNVVEPHLMGRRFGLSTLVVILSLIFWGWLWGPLGMLLSVPLTMILKILLENTEDFRWVARLLGPASGIGPAETVES